MNMRPFPEKKTKKTLAVLIAAGVILGLFTLLFAVANSDWVVVNIPSPPWETRPFVAAFEARLWAIMLVCFFVGSGIGTAAAIAVAVEHGKKAARQRMRMQELEGEIENLNRLLKATMSGEISVEKK